MTKLTPRGWTDKPTAELDYVVYIGRFQPPHLAHIELMKTALKHAKKLIVLAGSSNQPRTIKNPWTWQERSDMILESIPIESRDNVIVMPLHDILYNDQQWTQQVQSIVTGVAGSEAKVGIIGHSKDESSYYLSLFPQWGLIDVGNVEDIHASDIRESLFELKEEDFDIKIGRNLPLAIHNYLKAFTMRDEFDQLVKEHNFIKKYKSAWESAPYAPIFVTVDAVVVQSGHVLLVRRRAEPGKNLFAIPGGFVNADEQIKDAAIRELREETKINVPIPVLMGNIKTTFVADDPERSLRGRTISHVFGIELPPGSLPKISKSGGDDTNKAVWIPLTVFDKMENQLFEDHYHVVQKIVKQLNN